MNSRLNKQSSPIEKNLHYSSNNTVTVSEELAHFGYVFKQLVYQLEYHLLLDDRDRLESEEWFEKLDEPEKSSKTLFKEDSSI